MTLIAQRECCLEKKLRGFGADRQELFAGKLLESRAGVSHTREIFSDNPRVDLAYPCEWFACAAVSHVRVIEAGVCFPATQGGEMGQAGRHPGN
jgi:hypothetical protein